MTIQQIKNKIINNPEAAMILLIYGYGYKHEDVDNMSELEILDRADGEMLNSTDSELEKAIFNADIETVLK